MLPIIREEVKKAIHFKIPARPPLFTHKWISGDLMKKYGDTLREIVDRMPDDIIETCYVQPGNWEGPEDDKEYRWSHKDKGIPIDEKRGLESGELIIYSPEDYEPFLAKFPDPNRKGTFDNVKKVREENPDKYILGSYGRGFFESSWLLRGMENLLMDFILYPDYVHRLMQTLADYQCALIRRYAEAGIDGIFTTDDLGTQTSLMMGPKIFREFIKPRYRQIIAECHKWGLDFWLHSCGNVTEIMPDLVEVGVDVLHPIQPHCMNAHQIMRDFGGRICFIGGIDVQFLIPRGTPSEIRKGVKERLDTFYRPEGGCIIGLANFVACETHFANVEAYVDAVLEFCETLEDQQSAPTGLAAAPSI